MSQAPKYSQRNIKVMEYADITVETNNRDANRRKRATHLYASVFRDVLAILKILLPSDKAMVVGNHLKSAMYALIELKTGAHPDKF